MLTVVYDVVIVCCIATKETTATAEGKTAAEKDPGEAESGGVGWKGEKEG